MSMLMMSTTIVLMKGFVRTPHDDVDDDGDAAATAKNRVPKAHATCIKAVKRS